MAAIAAAHVSTNFSLDTTSPSMMLSSPTTTSPTMSTKLNTNKNSHPSRAVGVWSSEEHDRFLEALKKYPQGPWKAITEFVGMQTGKAIRLRREHRIDHDVLALHTLISSPPEFRNKHTRRSHVYNVKPVPVVTPPRVAKEPAHVITPEFQRPSLVSVEQSDKEFCPLTENDGASPSSVSSSFLFDDSVFALMDVDDLPTLSESLDFFIENFS
ncbi:Myb-like DNA-binding protein [Phytophthora megakarya]|uniref:Myb-like DNA-binding protein n=1 Tax=Phytophthora megakarya TaxID=4795 RepID=A0A225X246_9STRA|nr:Myb-like DNA-binding protein [Phytophthora megakarya]